MLLGSTMIVRCMACEYVNDAPIFFLSVNGFAA